MAKKFLFIVLFLSSSISLFSQAFSRGAILDSESYARVPQRAATRSLTPLPRSVSLKQFSPIPENQGAYGTCTGWAVAFAARTISESIALNRIDQRQSSDNAFSPYQTYLGFYSLDNRIPTYRQGGTIIGLLDYLKSINRQGAPTSRVIDYIKTHGAVRRPAFERNNDFPLILISAYENQQRYPIADYVRLFINSYGVPGAINDRVPPVKRSLAEQKPVIIAMNTPDSFEMAGYRGDIWQPHESPHDRHGGHAMVVVGYDDDKYGGAFEVQNSWGADWGNNGYIWITYNDFARFVYEAYEIIEDLMSHQIMAEFSGSVEIEMRDRNRKMDVEFVSAGYYKTKTSHPSGTLFRYIMKCDKPAYLYAFAADAHSFVRIFPPDGVLAVLDYRDNTFAFPPDRPGEIDWLELDDKPGTDYLVVLFSKQPLDIDAIARRFMSERGNFAQRVEHAVGFNYIRPHTARYERDRIAYTAQSTNANAVFGLLLAIEHH
ncbi:MAG: C1 family peptidase [Treponema sp.]|nr:C1 family peptidase [Treponema sp.]